LWGASVKTQKNISLLIYLDLCITNVVLALSNQQRLLATEAPQASKMDNLLLIQEHHVNKLRWLEGRIT
jgi:hypothetical protein